MPPTRPLSRAAVKVFGNLPKRALDANVTRGRFAMCGNEYRDIVGACNERLCSGQRCPNGHHDDAEHPERSFVVFRFMGGASPSTRRPPRYTVALSCKGIALSAQMDPLCARDVLPVMVGEGLWQYRTRSGFDFEWIMKETASGADPKFIFASPLLGPEGWVPMDLDHDNGTTAHITAVLRCL